MRYSILVILVAVSVYAGVMDIYADCVAKTKFDIVFLVDTSGVSSTYFSSLVWNSECIDSLMAYCNIHWGIVTFADTVSVHHRRAAGTFRDHGISSGQLGAVPLEQAGIHGHEGRRDTPFLSGGRPGSCSFQSDRRASGYRIGGPFARYAPRGRRNREGGGGADRLIFKTS